MLFPEVLRRLRETRDEAAVAALLAEDPALLDAGRRGAGAEGEPLAVYVDGACRRFLNAAPEEEWVTLMGRFSGGADPVAAVVQAAVRWRLRAGGGCSCGGGGGGETRRPDHPPAAAVRPAPSHARRRSEGRYGGGAGGAR